MKKNKKSVKVPSGDKKFEEFYFEGHYRLIGDFSSDRDRELSNWFSGMFAYINHYYPIKNGYGKKIIEFGCATGVVAKLLQGYGFDVCSTDISHYAVKLAKKNYPYIKFSVHDMHKLFPKEKNFDAAIAFDVVEHLKNPELAIKNVYKILKKGGVLILSTPNDYKHMYKDPTHINVKKPETWKKILQNVGYKDVIIRQITFVPYFYRIHRRLSLALPIGIGSPYLTSPVFIIAKK